MCIFIPAPTLGLILSLGIVGLNGAANVALAAPATVDYSREIRPLLSDKCFHCHGPDKSTRMAGLRLDTREGAFTERKGGKPIVPGNPAQSLVFQRVNAEDVNRRMPPSFSHKTLTDEQKKLIERWIEQGAKWSEHWSFNAPVRPVLPDVRGKSWVRNPVDQFILANLEGKGLQPAPEADRRRLARRVSFDLTGLPPTPADLQAFLADRSPQAYETYVDRLLASSHYGEHRARYWLDAARYADTHGLHIDNYREMWPYRDWVIHAFNRNLPFDRFTIEQLGGDLLPNRTVENQIASGFHRCNVTTNEAGSIEEEVEAMYAKDRVETTGTVWLGLTVGCASCHDHKFDPISQRDFYSLSAFFRNTVQPAMDGNVQDTAPVVILPRKEDSEIWAELNQQRSNILAKLRKVGKESGDRFDPWLAAGGHSKIASPIADEELFALDVAKASATSLPAGVSVGSGPGIGQQALRFTGKGALEFPNIKHFALDQPFTIAAFVYLPESEDSLSIANQAMPGKDFRGWSLERATRLASLRLGEQMEPGVDPLSIRSAAADRLKVGTWHSIVFTYDGSGEESGFKLFLNGVAKRTSPLVHQKLPSTFFDPAPLKLGSDGKNSFAGGAIADFRIYSRAADDDEARLLAQWQQLAQARAKGVSALDARERAVLKLWFLNNAERRYQRLSQELRSIEARISAIRRRASVTHVMEEKPGSPPMAHILFRGQYDQPKEQVEANVPASLPAMQASFPRNRLGLAQWLVSAENPLTARVTVNRFWQECFGTGLVKTTEDFGSQGEPPTNPELLDWLAVEFRESGWDMKRLFRLFVTSSAYRQAALATPERLAKDPDNRLLSRGPRFRMDAEMIRDSALASSGLLVSSIGGPSVKPYQPEGVWEAVAMKNSGTRFYKPDSGDKLYRRSLYTFWKRSAPHPAMEIYNSPTRENCTVRRERTNTPLQALVTMNDVQFVEAARSLGANAIRAHPADVRRQVDFLAQTLLARSLDEKERSIVKAAYDDHLRFYDSHPEDAKRLIKAGESEPDKALSSVELAALTLVANQLMNLDEFLNK